MKYSVLIKDKIYFGPYPDSNLLKHLKTINITTLVNLTTPKEIKSKYVTNLEVIKFSIPDCKAPTNILKFEEFVIKLINNYYSGKVMYVHCRGGHGRAGIVSMVLLKQLKNMNLKQVLEHFKTAHLARSNLKPKIIKLGIPQTSIQKKFVESYFSDSIKFYEKSGLYYELSNFFPCKLEINDKTYKSCEHYYQSQKYAYCKDEAHKNYTTLIENQTTPGKAFYLAKRIKNNRWPWMIKLNKLIDTHKVKLDPNWDDRRLEVMENRIES